MEYRITIKDWRPWPDNKLSGGTHWSVRSKRKKQDELIVSLSARIADTPKATGKRRVHLEIVLSGKQQQTDPLAYAKSTLDALTKCGMLIDDSTEYVEWITPTYRRDDHTQTTIVLTEVQE